jgi:hypothetical protein
MVDIFMKAPAPHKHPASSSLPVHLEEQGFSFSLQSQEIVISSGKELPNSTFTGPGHHNPPYLALINEDEKTDCSGKKKCLLIVCHHPMSLFLNSIYHAIPILQTGKQAQR